MPMRRGFLKCKDRQSQADKIERRVYTARDAKSMSELNRQLADVDPQQVSAHLMPDPSHLSRASVAP